MINPLTLDNVFPPTWDGPLEPLDERDTVADNETRLRHRERQDRYNYFVEQRIEGDLFKRDLVVATGIKRLVDFLSTRSGIAISSPELVLTGGSWVSLGKIYCPSNKLGGGWVVYMTIDGLEFSAPSSGSYTPPALSTVKLEVCRMDGGSVHSVLMAVDGTSTESSKWGSSTITGRGPAMLPDTEYDVRLTNTSSADAVCSARVMWNNHE